MQANTNIYTNLALAVGAVHNGLVIPAVAKHFSVSRSTLHRHLVDNKMW
jgi:transposase